ncbi:MAG: right-handed parallel beta-helix repeat-containing protein, partial [Bacteroidota bacterium]
MKSIFRLSLIGVFVFSSQFLQGQQRLYVNLQASGLNDGSSWANAFSDLQFALNTTMSNPQTDYEIWVAEGTYTPGVSRFNDFRIRGGVSLYGGFDGTEALLSDRAVDADGRFTIHETVLSGDIGQAGTLTDNSYHIMEIDPNLLGDVVLDGIRISHGYADNSTFPNDYGAGIYIRILTSGGFATRNINIQNCFISDNFSGGSGGAVYYEGGFYEPITDTLILFAKLNFDNCAITQNKAATLGGAIAVYRGIMELKNCDISQNEAEQVNINQLNGVGGAVHIFEATAEFEGCVLASNTTDLRGGAVFAERSTTSFKACRWEDNAARVEGGAYYFSTSEVVLEDCFFASNSARLGGGLYGFVSDFSMVRDSFFFNSAIQDGAGLNARASGGEIRDCIFQANVANTRGGGLFLVASTGTDIINSQFKFNSAAFRGGGIMNLVSSPLIRNCIFEGDTSRQGGGILNEDFSNPHISNCTFVGNCGGSDSNCDGEGGGIVNLSNSDAMIDSCSFVANTAYRGAGLVNNQSDTKISYCAFEGNNGDLGVALLNQSLANTEINHCAFAGNTGLQGAAILNRPSTNTEINFCTFEGNVGTEGAAMHNQASSNTEINFCNFYENIAYRPAISPIGAGGAIFNNTESNTTIANSAFGENHARLSGGAVYNGNNSNSSIFNCTFSTNTTDFFGGAVFLLEGDSVVQITSSTFYQNAAPTGGGIAFSDNTTTLLKNCIVANNLGGNFHHTSNTSILLSSGYNFVSDTSGGRLQPLASDIYGTSANPIDPLLDTLGFFSGPTRVHPPLPNSPVLGAGLPLNEIDIKTDQRGYSRIRASRDAQIDIGAFEAQSTYVISAARPRCLGDDAFFNLPEMAMIDSTGGAFGIGENQSMVFSLQDGLEFAPNTGTVECEGLGLSDCSLDVMTSTIILSYTRSYDTTVNSIRIRDLQLKTTPNVSPGQFALLRSGGDAIQYDHQIADSIAIAQLTAYSTLRLKDGAYDEAFENDRGEWTPDSPHSIWEWGAPEGSLINQAASGANVWMTGLNKVYPANDTSWLASPCFDFQDTENPIIGLNIWANSNQGFDGTVLQVSLDEGFNWQTVGNNNSGLAWYNSSTLFANPGQQNTLEQYGWTGQDSSWRRARVKLTGLQNEDAVRFRLAFASISLVDTTVANDGFAMDDFFIGESNKKVLLEHFSSSDQMEANEQVRDLVTPLADFIVPIQFYIKAGDLFYDQNPAGPRARALYYSISETSMAIVDGQDFIGRTPELSSDVLETSLLKESPISIDIDTTITASISISSSRDIAEELIVQLAVVEHTEEQPYVLRKFLPDAAGTSYPELVEGITESLNLSWPANDILAPADIVENYDSLEVVVFVQNRETKEIYQV